MCPRFNSNERKNVLPYDNFSRAARAGRLPSAPTARLPLTQGRADMKTSFPTPEAWFQDSPLEPSQSQPLTITATQ